MDTRLLSTIMPSVIACRTLLFDDRCDLDGFACALVEQILLCACSTRMLSVRGTRARHHLRRLPETEEQAS